ncbi:MAG: hypothetical protein OSB62_07900 [Alphaproteobacteria bacterium]|nr:hypothetical protein [Alphaproteobacteria bacterium]
MTYSTRQDIEIFLSVSNLNRIFDRLFPLMKNRHFRAYPVRTQNGYAVEVFWYDFERGHSYPITHKDAEKMKASWQCRPLPSLQETCDIKIGYALHSIRFFHRKGYINIPP